jgi:hypothetical protein
MVIISNLCGHFGGRGVSRFVKAHQLVFKEQLKLKHPVPSHVTFCDLLRRTDSGLLVNAFNKWSSDYVPLQENEAISGDGKALASTVSDQHGKHQDFEAVVSLFCQKSGLILALEQYRNRNKENEIGVVRFLIGQLKNMGLTFYLDALHAQKKR